MEAGAFFILGFLAILCSRSLLGTTAAAADMAVYAAALFALFHTAKRPAANGFLAGITVGVELLGNAKFGQATLLAFTMVSLQAILGERLRFTSRFLRYIVALLITMLAYTLLFLTPGSFFAYLPTSIGITALAGSIGYLISSTKKESDYELL